MSIDLPLAGEEPADKRALALPGGLLGRVMGFELVLARCENAVAIAALTVAILSVTISIVIRSFALSVPDTGEWAIVAMAPLTFVGAGLCSHLHKHLTADIVETLPDGWLRRGLDAVASALCFAFGLFFVVIAWDLFEYALSSREKLTDLGAHLLPFPPVSWWRAQRSSPFTGPWMWRALAGREPGGIDPWH